MPRRRGNIDARRVADRRGKRCPCCGEYKQFDDFGKNWCRPDGRTVNCKKCNAKAAAETARRNPLRRMVASARSRAKSKGVDFDPRIADEIRELPPTCPLLGVPLLRSDGGPSDNSPSVDRIVPQLGYVPGNVWVISYRANRFKSDASLEELEMLTKNLRAKVDELAAKGEPEPLAA